MESGIARIMLVLWLLFSPFSVLVVLVTSLILFLFLKSSSARDKCLLRIMGIILLLSSCLTVFNLFDFWHFRKYGCQALSPINRDWFLLCFPPEDLNEPYCKIPLNEEQTEYKIKFRHKYRGDHAVALNAVNNVPKPFDYDNPDRIGLSFSTGINTVAQPWQSVVSGEKSYEEYFLHSGTNVLNIISYDFSGTASPGEEYEATVRIDGNLREFLLSYPGSYISIRNSTHK